MSLSIAINKPAGSSYLPGEIMTGVVYVDLEGSILYLNILIEGKADVKIYENQTYTDGHGYRHTHQKYFNADEIYLNSTIPLLVCATLPRGRSIFPFQYALPLTHLPCTIEASHGAISYTITANIKSAAFPDGVLREAIFFIVGSHLDLNTIRLKDAYRANVFRDVRPIEGCCCSFTQPTESILHELYVPKRVFIPGEFIQFQMKIENKTKGVRLESGVMKFVLLVTCNGKGTTRKNETVLGQVAGPEVKPGSVQNWEVNNLWVPVIKPVGIPATGLEECGIIDAHYELQFEVDYEEGWCDKKTRIYIYVPLIIGTIALNAYR